MRVVDRAFRVFRRIGRLWYAGAGGRSCAVSGPGAHADPHAHADPNSDTVAPTDTDSNSYAHSDTYAHANPHAVPIAGISDA